jgi:hypothetical protein
MKVSVGDLVRYEDAARQGIEMNVALVVELIPMPGDDFVNVLWDDGEICSHAVDEFEVINES